MQFAHLWAPNVLRNFASCYPVGFVRFESGIASLALFFFRWSHVRELAMKKQDELHQLVMKLQVISMCTLNSHFLELTVGRVALDLFSDADADSILI